MAQYRLSKSKYVAGFQCEKRLWLEVHDKGKATPPDKARQRLFSQSHQVGAMARHHLPGGKLIEGPPFDIPGALQRTCEVLDLGINTL